MNLQLQGSVAAVTGGTSGIGLATVRALLAEGVRVSFCGRSKERLQSARDELSADFDHTAFYGNQCDVLDEQVVDRFAKQTLDHFGAVDLLINNAGQRRMTTFDTTDDQDWNDELQLKFFSIIRPTRAFLPALENSSRAAIVCINSLLALQPEPHLVATAAARAGVLNLTRSLATEFAPKGIRVNSILLGIVNSGQWRAQYENRVEKTESYEDWLVKLAKEKRIPLGRFGKPEEAANAIAFLASPVSAYTTGAAIDVSGGVSRHI